MCIVPCQDTSAYDVARDLNVKGFHWKDTAKRFGKGTSQRSICQIPRHFSWKNMKSPADLKKSLTFENETFFSLYKYIQCFYCFRFLSMYLLFDITFLISSAIRLLATDRSSYFPSLLEDASSPPMSPPFQVLPGYWKWLSRRDVNTSGEWSQSALQ